MARFSLLYPDDEFGSANRIEFEASDAFGALRIAQAEAPGRTAELWQGERRLCTLRRTGPDGTVWEIGPGDAGAGRGPALDREAWRPLVAA